METTADVPQALEEDGQGSVLGRLPVCPLEIRRVDQCFSLRVDHLARCANMYPELVRVVEMDEAAVVRAAWATAAEYVVKRPCSGRPPLGGPV